MPPWTLWQYDAVVSEFMQEAEPDLWEEMEARLFSLTEQGNLLGWPASEPIGNGTGLCALRAKAGTKQGRLLYFFLIGRRIVFVHSIDLKKTRRIPQHDINIAVRRKREVELMDDLTEIAKPFRVTLQ